MNEDLNIEGDFDGDEEIDVDLDEDFEEDDEDFDEEGDEEAPDYSWAKDWEWAKELDPNKVNKTWDKFTDEWAGVLKEKESLAPLAELRDELQKNPKLVAVIEDFYENGGGKEDATKKEIENLRREVEMTRSEIHVEKEMAGLEKWALDNDYPAPDKDKLIKYAIENGINSLKTAYRDMNFEDMQEAKADKLASDIKKTRGAKLPKSRQSAGGKTQGYSAKDIQDMSEEDFINSYGEIAKAYSK